MPIRPSAFTLIELLVVVSVIAILAALALPNFLEAQARSKVGRVAADQRVVLLGIEMYRLDNNAYPPHTDTLADMTRFTTPVSYLGDIPRDPFAKKANPIFRLYGPYYGYEGLADIFFFRNPTWGGGDWLARQVTGGRQYLIISLGPDGEDQIAEEAVRYDPTNGTISRGDIFIMGP
jgi:prepilin-type N-terminal cleavage/methylation domain-containing protein